MRFADTSHNALVVDAFSARLTTARPFQHVRVLVLLFDDHTGRHSVQASQSWGWKSTEGRETERGYVTNSRHLSSLCHPSLKRRNGYNTKTLQQIAHLSIFTCFTYIHSSHTNKLRDSSHTARSLPCRAGTTLHVARQNNEYLLRRCWRSQLRECGKTHTTPTSVAPTDVV